jgi:hypothetical protein
MLADIPDDPLFHHYGGIRKQAPHPYKPRHGLLLVTFIMNHLLLLHIKRIRFVHRGNSEYKTLVECLIVTFRELLQSVKE